MPKSPLVALAPWCPAAPYPVSPQPALSSHPLPTPTLLVAGEASRYTFLTHTFLTNSTLQTCQGRNTRGSDFTPIQRGGGRPWRGQGERGTHVINIKSYLLQMEDIYCTSLTHIHKNTIYTERLGRVGAVQGVSEVPLLPSRRWHIRASRHSGVHHAEHMGGLTPPCPPRCLTPEERQRGGRGEGRWEQLPRDPRRLEE